MLNMTIRPATPAEQLFAHEQSIQIAVRCGNSGYLRGTLDNPGSEFVTHWETIVDSEEAPEFKTEFNMVLDMLRFDERYAHALKNRSAMSAYCFNHSQGCIRNEYEYAFRADTKDYVYLIRCILAGGDDNVYIYPYHRDFLTYHMEQAEKGVRFITPDGKEIFRVQDGDMIRIITGTDSHLDCMARYVDENHAEIGGGLYQIREFAEWIEKSGSQVIPMHSTLPDKCYNVLPSSNEIIVIRKGESGYYPTNQYGNDRSHARAIVDEYNAELNVTKAQAAAMLAGSMFGWHTLAANPKRYNEYGKPIVSKQHDE